MLADKQVSVLDLTNSTITSQADLQTTLQSLHLCSAKKMSYHMAEKNPKKTQIPNDYLSDSDSSGEETSQHLCTSPEERLYHTVKGSAQTTQVALANTMAK